MKDCIIEINNHGVVKACVVGYGDSQRYGMPAVGDPWGHQPRWMGAAVGAAPGRSLWVV